jgi:predicted transcriptional regulator of viral defense system
MDCMALDARVALVARRQGGAFTWAQARAVGFGRATVGRRLRTGLWERMHPGVYVLAGTPPARSVDLWVAVLAAGVGALVSHESAALLHGATGLPSAPITLTAPHGAHHRLAGLRVHQIDDVHRRNRTRVDGLPVVTAARSIIDLASCLASERLGGVADDLVQRRATTWPAIGGAFGDVVRPGKPGMATLARLLDDRCGSDVPAQSTLEQALFTSLAAGGLPPPLRQMSIPGRVRSPSQGLVDAAYPDAGIVIEADGRTYHMRLIDMRRDRERDAQVVKAGWVPLRFMYEQIVHDPGAVCADIAATRAVRLDQLVGRLAA